MADLATTTVAAMAPRDMDVSICDEEIAPADLDTTADVVGLTGKVTQTGRMIALAQEYRARGKVVLIGGPYASLDPEVFRPHCDILVRGELEGIAERLFADLKGGRARDDYDGGRPDLERVARAAMGPVSQPPRPARLRPDLARLPVPV